MHSDLPKVMHEACGQADWFTGSSTPCTPRRRSDTRRARGRLRSRTGRRPPSNPAPTGSRFAIQEEQLGTGHAIDMARPFFEDETSGPDTDVLVLCGDGPLIRPETLVMELEERTSSTGAAATLATAILEDRNRLRTDPAGSADGQLRPDRRAEGRHARSSSDQRGQPELLHLPGGRTLRPTRTPRATRTRAASTTSPTSSS